ncbi:Hpt domain-containing protein [Polaribacter ponticola]|uniref:Hpt domain-containing protein n=1 Tax=Polaribacter ponticola TaxID=2978475 RepID=A0ABT5SB91_9FLAO|nr:Hpt domain-containing protein [Polaribacter sp. MSW5]MDD7915382.1 Hpt domain-containing protein [Polaribacter sp. MSW5]
MEKPNLSFIKEIAGDDIEFQNSILEIIKKEFPDEVEQYHQNFSSKKYKEAANNVHKIKHKISLLGLVKGLELASEFELQLKNENTELHENFIEILNKIHVYLYA